MESRWHGGTKGVTMKTTTVLDVRKLGARGDGKTDDTGAFQKALDAAGTCGGTVVVPPGVYPCGELHMRAGTGLAGYPAWSYRESRGSVLCLNDADASCLLNLTGAFGATVSGLCLRGKGTGTRPVHGILVEKQDYGTQEDTVRIDGCRIEQFAGDGIRLERIWCFSVRHTHCFHNAGCGVRVRGWDGFLIDNWFSGNGMAGFGAYDENASCTLTGNRIEWNRKGGIVIVGGSHYNITGNYIDRSGRNGICLLPDGRRTCRHLTLTGNLLYRSGKPDWGYDSEDDSAHVRCDSVSGLVLTGNVMTAGRDDGDRGQWSPDACLVVRRLEHAVIRGNAMHEGSLRHLVVDRGGHGEGVVLSDNVGSLKKTGG